MIHILSELIVAYKTYIAFFTTRESNFGGNNVSFAEINFREAKIFKYMQMALPKKKFQCFFVMKYC